MRPLDEPTQQDYADALLLQHTAAEAGVGLGVLFAMVLRRLGCAVSTMRREDPRVRAGHVADGDG